MWTVVYALAALLVAVLAGAVAFNVGAYAGAARHRRRHPPACPADADDDMTAVARVLTAARAFAVECVATAMLALSAPLGLRRLRIVACDGEQPRRPVVFLHGYGQHAGNFLWLARRLRRDGWPHLYAVGHTAAWGDIERSGQRLSATIDRILAETGADRVDVVAHSMGGLVARACLRLREGRGVGRLITLGTPHGGTAIFSRLARDPMVRQMRTGSPLLAALGADAQVLERVDCTAIYSADDAVVVPASAGYWPGAFNVEVRGVGHNSLLFSPRVYELVRENLAAPSPAAVGRAEHGS